MQQMGICHAQQANLWSESTVLYLYGVLQQVQVYRYLVGRCGKVPPLAQFERHARRTKELRGTKMGVVSRRGRSRELTRNVHIETFEPEDASQGAIGPCLSRAPRTDGALPLTSNPFAQQPS